MKSVAVITRTKDRPFLLKRVLDSLRTQTFQDFVWVLVNDGGNREFVDHVVNDAINLNLYVKTVHLDVSKGRSGAANSGLTQVNTEYIVFLDDDDTWHPNFLRKTTDFLKNTENKSYGGVATRSFIVKERIKGERILIKNIYPYDADINSVTLYRIASRYKNFAIHSFLYRRKIIDQIGCYREDLPTLEDWEFNLRFLLSSDIGFIPEFLANYHQRINYSVNYRNTVIFDRSLQDSYHAIICNEFLREDINNNRVGLGFIVNQCHDVKYTNRKIEQASLVSLVTRNLTKLFYKFRFLVAKGNGLINYQG